jgi:hypothetical protein
MPTPTPVAKCNHKSVPGTLVPFDSEWMGLYKCSACGDLFFMDGRRVCFDMSGPYAEDDE